MFKRLLLLVIAFVLIVSFASAQNIGEWRGNEPAGLTPLIEDDPGKTYLETDEGFMFDHLYISGKKR